MFHSYFSPCKIVFQTIFLTPLFIYLSDTYRMGNLEHNKNQGKPWLLQKIKINNELFVTIPKIISFFAFSFLILMVNTHLQTVFRTCLEYVISYIIKVSFYIARFIAPRFREQKMETDFHCLQQHHKTIDLVKSCIVIISDHPPKQNTLANHYNKYNM